MNALCRSYNGTADAERAVQSLLAGGVPGEDILLLMGAEPHDARSESRGTFAAAVAPDGRVGTYAGEGVRRDEPRGSFAGGSDGEGVFANADRDVVVTYPDGRERSRVAGHRTLKRLLVDAGLDDDVAEADVRALHDGRVLVLVTTNAVTFERATELITA
jgi:hypothetical protein